MLSACLTTDRYESSFIETDLEVTIADSFWDGKSIPEGQQCVRFGGKNPMTPRLKINNIPPGTSAIIMEYSDRSYPSMDYGGHGIVGYRINKGTRSVIIPSIPGYSYELPDGFFIISSHRGSWFHKAGAYLPPCSGGRKNSYYVTIKAVSISSNNKEETMLLGKAVVELGIY